MEKKVEELEDDFKVLKNEIKESLTDIREHLLTYIENPFAMSRPTTEVQVVGMTHKIMVEAAPEQSNSIVVKPEPEPAPLAKQTEPEDSAPPENETPEKEESPSPLSQKNPSEVLQQLPALANLELPPLGAASEMTVNQESTPFDQGLPPDAGLGPESATQPQVKTSALGNGKAGELGPEEYGTGLPGPTASEYTGEEPAEPSGKPRGAAEGTRERGNRNDLLTVFTLASWLESGIARIGRKRMKAIVEVYASTSELAEPLKGALFQIINMDGSSDGARNKVSLKDCLRLLAELDSLLWRNRFDPTGAALLSVFLNNGDPSE